MSFYGGEKQWKKRNEGNFTLTRGGQDSRAETSSTAAKPKKKTETENQRGQMRGDIKLNQEGKKKEYKTRKIEANHHRYRDCLGVLREEKEQFFLTGFVMGGVVTVRILDILRIPAIGEGSLRRRR